MFTAPLFSAFCALAAYLFVKEIRGQGAGLTAAAFMAMVPSYISRSVAGSYDNEGVAIFALVFVFYLYVKVQTHPRLCHAAAPVAWGGQPWGELHAFCAFAAIELILFDALILFDRRHVATCHVCGRACAQALNTGSLAWSSAAALAYLYMVGRPSG